MTLTMLRPFVVLCLCCLFSCPLSKAATSLGTSAKLVLTNAEGGSFPLVQKESAASIWIDEADHNGVRRAAEDLQKDIASVTKIRPSLSNQRPPAGQPVIIIGTLGKSKLIDQLAKDGKIPAEKIAGQWEAFLISTVDKPLDGVDQALIIAGSDKRGTIYGIYELSEQIGVSPWYWWADVPVKQCTDLHIRSGLHVEGPPTVKYRGIFINDEEPAFGSWAREKFGGVNSKMYARMFELLLRLRGNYLWPAMWGKAFNEDDPDNPRLADEYGIVMGTSHHEPMMRAQKEWTKRKTSGEYGNGEWNYATNEEGLKKFWEEGIVRNKNFENIITIGMRGDGDEPMIEGGDMASNSKLLERIVNDQRALIANNVNPDVSSVPQLWALYKEVQDYYDQGMRVPDDVTLLWCDDNWGNIRRLPTPEERDRTGGAGVYYHFDYVGGPRSYKWLNTNPLPKIWEQMNLAAEYGATRIWIVNVGDLKPMEVPMEFFLRMAWNPSAWPKDKIAEFTRLWAEREFGVEHAGEISDLVNSYAKFNGWRKPELVSHDTFSLINYREAERVSASWNDLVARAEKVNAVLPADQRDAFFQLVLYPIKASATVVNLHIAVGRNRLYAKQGRVAANAEASRVRELFQQDQNLSDTFHKQIANGKWNHMMAQTRIGYTSWQDPKANILPELQEILVPESSAFGVAIEGSETAWPGNPQPAVLPVFDSLNRQKSYIDVFARGSHKTAASFTVDQPWIQISEEPATSGDIRIWVEIDWTKAPLGESRGIITVTGNAESIPIEVTARRATPEQEIEAKGAFGGLAGPISIAATAATKVVSQGDVRWEKIPDYGRGDGAMTIFPVTAPSVLPPEPAPRLEYPVYFAQSGRYAGTLIVGPSLPFIPNRGLRVAVGIDDKSPQVLDLYPKPDAESDWADSVRDNVRAFRFSVNIEQPGKHNLVISMVDPGIALQKIILHQERPPSSYFGPQETSLNSSR